MKYLNGECFVEFRDRRYRIHPTENNILRKRGPPISLRTQYQVQNETKTRRNQKIIKNDNDELIVKNYPKIKQPINQQQLPICPSCDKIIWFEFDKGYYCKNGEFNFNKQKHQIDQKVLRIYRGFSNRLNFANKKRREIWMNMVNNKYNSAEEMIKKL